MMVHFPSSPQSGHELSSSSSPSSSGHTVMYSFLVFAFLGTVIALVSAILYFKRSKTSQKRRKHSKPEDEHSGTQIRPKMNEGKERSFVKLSSFPTSITPVQVNRYTSSSSSSSLEETEREDGEQFWRYNLRHEHCAAAGLPHGMATCQVRTKQKEPNGDRSPRLTFSLRVVPTREERVSDEQKQENRIQSQEVKSIHLSLVQACNLQRSFVDPSTCKNPFSPPSSPFSPLSSPFSPLSSSFSPLPSPGEAECSVFQAEGVFARIFPSSERKVKNVNISSSPLSSYEKERIGEEERIEDFDSSTTAGDESWMRMKEEGKMKGEGKMKEEVSGDVIESPVMKSQRSKDISFKDLDFSIPLEQFHFPVRVTLYEVDRNGVRFSLGHTFIPLPPNLDTGFVVQTNKLYSTIYRAKNSIKFIK